MVEDEFWYLPILAIVLIFSIAGLVFGIIGVSKLIKKAEEKKHILKHSDVVAKYKENRPPKAWEERMLDDDGKLRKVCHYEERIPEGTQCYLNEKDMPFIKEFINLVFAPVIDTFGDSITQEKITRLLNAKEKSGKCHMDTRYFFKNPKYTIFPFHLTQDKRSQIMLYYCQTRSLKLIELPQTSFSSASINYVAYFNINCFEEMSFLAFLMEKPPLTPGHEMFGFRSSIDIEKISQYGHSRDFVFEYIYRLLISDCFWFHPDEDAYQEMSMRVLKSYGYPPPYEYQSLLAEITSEMQQKGIIKSKKHTYNEQLLFSLVKEKFSDAKYQYRDQWLGLQTLDVYIPSLKVAIEYQGGQHYESVKFFGGKKTFDAIQKRDSLKNQLCVQQGVKLIEWKYDVPVTKENLEKYLCNL